VDGDVAVHSLNEMEGINMLLRRVAPLFAGKIKADDPVVAEINHQLGELWMGIHPCTYSGPSQCKLF
jgi:DNA-directed RNA polymerase subunit H (RpoH/RPB5)